MRLFTSKPISTSQYLQRDAVLHQQADLDVHFVEIVLELLIGSNLFHYFLLHLLDLCSCAYNCNGDMSLMHFII